MASAAITAGGSILSGILGGLGASSAAKQQAKATQAALDLQKQEFNTTQSNIQPDIWAGHNALYSQLRLLGIGDGLSDMPTADQQKNELASIKDSPLYTTAFNQGTDAILQNAAATGGLRGGNTENSLATFGGNLFSQMVQQQIANLGAVSGQGVGATKTAASVGQDYADSSSKLLGQQGSVNAVAAGTPYASAVNTLGSLQALLRANTGGPSSSSQAQSDWGVSF